MYAVVKTGGKQAKVFKDAVLAVESIEAEVGAVVTLPVLFVADEDRILATPAELAGVSVSAEVLEHFKGEKQIVFKFKKRKGYKRTKGHRQQLTSVRVTDIVLEGAPAKAAKAKPKAEPKAETKAEPAAEAVATAAPVEAAQCEAVKSDGTRCANKAKDGSKYCGVHAKKYEG
jgi:large subunit ribosomal protein L21